MKKTILFISLLLMCTGFLSGVVSKDWYTNDYMMFSTDKHSKSKGLNMTIRYPNDWVQMEGDRPNVVQKFLSKGDDNACCLILTQALPLPDNYVATDEEFNFLFDKTEAISMLPSESEYISFTKTKIEGQLAGILEYRVQSERTGVHVLTQTIMYYFVYKKTLVMIQCSVGGIPKDKKQIIEQFENQLPVFSHIANSIVLPDRWSH